MKVMKNKTAKKKIYQKTYLSIVKKHAKLQIFKIVFGHISKNKPKLKKKVGSVEDIDEK